MAFGIGERKIFKQYPWLVLCRMIYSLILLAITSCFVLSGNSIAFLPQALRHHSLKLQSSSKDANKEISCLHGISKDRPSNISGSDSSGTTPENNVSLLVEQDKCHSSHDNIKYLLVADHVHTVTSGKHEFSSSFVMENISCSSSQDVSQSQISGPDTKLTLTPLSQIGFCDPASIGCGQQLTIMSVEVSSFSMNCIDLFLPLMISLFIV